MKRFFLFGIALFLIACTEARLATHVFKKATSSPAPYNAPPVQEKRKFGSPYTVLGQTYHPLKTSEGYRAKGIASWYGKDFHGKKTANGERYNMYAMTAAHPSLPLPTWVRVTNLENGRSVLLRVNDRGPFLRGRLIDLSLRAAQELDMEKAGTAPVLVEALPIDGSVLRPKEHPVQEAYFGPHPKSVHPKGVQRKPVRLAERIVRQKITNAPDVDTLDLRPHDFRDSEYKYKYKKYKLKNTKVFVQVGAFSYMENAEAQRDKVVRVVYQDFPVQLTELERAGHLLHRVRVGPFESVSDADSVLAKLVRSGFNTAMIVVD